MSLNPFALERAPMTRLTRIEPESASQTAGPYVHIGLAPRAAGFEIFAQDFGAAPNAAPAVAAAGRLVLEGRVLDGLGEPVRDAVIEGWAAGPDGAHVEAGPERSWARSACDAATGLWRLDLPRPGPIRLAEGRWAAPHASLWIVARGINTGLHTRAYLDDEAEANAADPALRAIQPPSRRATLIAVREARGDAAAYRLDIRLQGPGETVFFEL